MGTSTEENLWESDIEKLLEIDVHTYPSYDYCASAQLAQKRSFAIP